MKLENALRKDLSHQWTVEEMAAMVGLGTTSFSEKVKNYSGFSPMNYLINIRISEAIKLLKKQSKCNRYCSWIPDFIHHSILQQHLKNYRLYTERFQKKNI